MVKQTINFSLWNQVYHIGKKGIQTKERLSTEGPNFHLLHFSKAFKPFVESDTTIYMLKPFIEYNTTVYMLKPFVRYTPLSVHHSDQNLTLLMFSLKFHISKNLYFQNIP